jgi:hypothetical protein
MTQRTFHIHVESTPDGVGRQNFTMTWEDIGGVYRPELSKDGKPVGYRRGQYFHAILDTHVARTLGRGDLVEFTYAPGVAPVKVAL